MDEPYYRADLARVHHLGFAHHAPLVAPGILRLLEPVRASGGLVVEFGCGSGLLTRLLLEAGPRRPMPHRRCWTSRAPRRPVPRGTCA